MILPKYKTAIFVHAASGIAIAVVRIARRRRTGVNGG
jgi:hypothetical protein